MVDAIENEVDRITKGLLKCLCGERSVPAPGQVLASQKSTGGNPMSVYLSVGTAITVSISAVANAVGLIPNSEYEASLYLEEVSAAGEPQHLVSGQHNGAGDLSVPLGAIVALRANVSYVIRFDDHGHDNRSGTNNLTVTVVSAP